MRLVAWSRPERSCGWRGSFLLKVEPWRIFGSNTNSNSDKIGYPLASAFVYISLYRCVSILYEAMHRRPVVLCPTTNVMLRFACCGLRCEIQSFYVCAATVEHGRRSDILIHSDFRPEDDDATILIVDPKRYPGYWNVR